MDFLFGIQEDMEFENNIITEEISDNGQFRDNKSEVDRLM